MEAGTAAEITHPYQPLREEWLPHTSQAYPYRGAVRESIRLASVEQAARVPAVLR